MFLLDTDHIVIIQQQTQPEYDRLLSRTLQHSPDAFYASIVSFHEQVMGWNAYLSRSKSSASIVRGYERLGRMLADYCEAEIAPFTEDAAALFDDLRQRPVRIGTMDLRMPPPLLHGVSPS